MASNEISLMTNNTTKSFITTANNNNNSLDASTSAVKAHHRRTSSLWVPPSRPAFSNPAPIIRHKAERGTRALKNVLPFRACCCDTNSSSASSSKPEFRKVLPNHRFDANTPRYEHPNRRNYADNRICTTKYNLITFLPKNLFEQFHRAANLYFIFIVILNMTIGAFGRYISMIPITFVLMVTAVKDAFEDYRRYKSDVKINHSTCRVWDNEQRRYRKMEWRHVLVGDFVHLSCNEIIPADILLLKSSDENGICYVETSNLDGESSLKQRQIISSMGSASLDFTPPQFTATVYCEQPNNQIYRFNGYLEHENGVKEAVDKMNLLLRGCEVRNTDFVEGIVLYAGRDTKAMLNNSGPRYKRSELERLTNWDIIWCVLILLLMCLTGAIFSTLWLSSFTDPYQVPYLTYVKNIDSLNPHFEGFVNFWSYIIVLQVMIPISLYVSIEIIKLGQIYLTSQDTNLYYDAVDKRIECRALNIPEELGQVQYVMSDKTGTLTENQMIFRRCYVAEHDYGTETTALSTTSTHPATTSSAIMKVDTELQKRLTETFQSFFSKGDYSFVEDSSQSDLLHFFINMAICNTVVVNAQPHHDHLDESGFFIGESFIAGNSAFHLPSPTSKNPPQRVPSRRPTDNSKSSNPIQKVTFTCGLIEPSSPLNTNNSNKLAQSDGEEITKKIHFESPSNRHYVKRRLNNAESTPNYCQRSSITPSERQQFPTRALSNDEVTLKNDMMPNEDITQLDDDDDETLTVPHNQEANENDRSFCVVNENANVTEEEADGRGQMITSVYDNCTNDIGDNHNDSIELSFSGINESDLANARKRIAVGELLDTDADVRAEDAEESNAEKSLEGSTAVNSAVAKESKCFDECDERLNRSAPASSKPVPPHHSVSVPDHLSSNDPVISHSTSEHSSMMLAHLLGSAELFRISSTKLLSLNFSKLHMKGFKLSPLLRFKKSNQSSEEALEGDVVQNPIYEAESPDELALVEAASDHGIRLCSRHLRSTLLQIAPHGFILKYKILHILPFDSDRKRMSVVVKDQMGRIVVYCKGADSAILPVISQRFSNSSRGAKIICKCDEYISLYSSCGLRTLCLCKRFLSEDEYIEWKLEHDEAEMALEDREKKLSESAHRIETDLELLGVSAIEDRLQDGVAECIEALRKAGINVWVLTGDKIETAVNIAYASKLFSSSMELIQLSALSEEDTNEMLNLIYERICSGLDIGSALPASAKLSSLTRRITPEAVDPSINTLHSSTLSQPSTSAPQFTQFGIVVSGATLAFCLLQPNIHKFLKIVERSNAVLCCRATPLQKASLVRLVKEQLRGKVLAIGDGANDVSMIQCADIGIGISGQEGMQAVMASDFALARFRFLIRLLLVHGHWCYYRLSLIILYFFYKNALFVFVLFWCQMYNGFSAQVPIDPIYLMVYNFLFTSVPSLLFGILDQDASADLLLQYPFLYAQGRQSKLYRWYSFWLNILDALWQSAAIYFTAHFVFVDTECDVWKFGFVLCTQLLFVNSFHFAILVNFWTSALVISLVLSIVAYFMFALIYNAIVSPAFNVKDPPVMVADFAICDIRFWLVLILSTAIALSPRLIVSVLINTFHPSAVLRQRMRQNAHKCAERNTTSIPMRVRWVKNSKKPIKVIIGNAENDNADERGASTTAV